MPKLSFNLITKFLINEHNLLFLKEITKVVAPLLKIHYHTSTTTNKNIWKHSSDKHWVV